MAAGPLVAVLGSDSNVVTLISGGCGGYLVSLSKASDRSQTHPRPTASLDLDCRKQRNNVQDLQAVVCWSLKHQETPPPQPPPSLSLPPPCHSAY